MAHKHITQTGLNRVIWKLLAAVGGKFSITDSELRKLKHTSTAIRVDYMESNDTFTLKLVKVKSEKTQADLILPQVLN